MWPHTMLLDWRLRSRIYFLLACWLRHPFGLNGAHVSEALLVSRLLNVVGVMLERGLLDLNEDAAALTRVVDWARRMEPGLLRDFEPVDYPDRQHWLSSYCR